MSTIDTFTRLFQRADWMDRGACRGLDTATRDRLFFPGVGTSVTSVNQAKAICADCPVSDECLAYAIENKERFGIWGGTSERERRVIRGAGPSAPIQHGTVSGHRAHYRHMVPMCEPCREANRQHAAKYRAAS